MKFNTDPRFLAWIGASIIPKLESAKDMFISRDKFLVNYINYKDQFSELKSKQVKNFLNTHNDGERGNKDEEKKATESNNGG